jgi:sugar lactone lactonase YvrE
VKNIFSFFSFVLFFSLFLSFPVKAFAQSADAWTTFQHDIQHTGRSSAIGPKSPYLKWTFNSPDDINGSPAILADGTIYLAIGGNGGGLYKMDANGTTQWIFPLRGTAATPAVATDGTIYVGTTPDPDVGAGLVYAINPDGTQKWRFEIPHASSGIITSQTIGLDGTIYTVGYVEGHGQLIAINPDGTLKWIYAFPGVGEASPSFSPDGNTLYVGQTSGLYAFNLDGTVKWHVTTEGNFAWASPAVGADGSIYATSGNIIKFDPNGNVIWRGAAGGAPVLASDGTVYGASDNLASALNPDGTLKWTFPAFHIRTVPVVDGDNTLYFATDDGKKAYAVNPDGTLLWQYEIGCSQSNASLGPDGTFYIGTSGCPGKFLYAFGPPPPSLTSLSPAEVWMGVKNGQDRGLALDLRAEVYKDDTFVTAGQVDSVGDLDNGFGKARLVSIPLDPFAPVGLPAGSELKLTVSGRNACVGSGRNSGTARLWYNDDTVDSQVSATIDEVVTPYFLLENFLLGTNMGTHKENVDISAGAPCSPFKQFGTWTVTL